jgi:hypothetical protein
VHLLLLRQFVGHPTAATLHLCEPCRLLLLLLVLQLLWLGNLHHVLLQWHRLLLLLVLLRQL